MDSDNNLFINFIPIISVTMITLVSSNIIFYYLKTRWPVQVNCWFCNKNTKIKKQSKDWWICPNCNQYNGFSKDGDYNYEIPEQFETFDNNYKNKSYCERKDISLHQNTLCQQCNKKEELKLFKLRELEHSFDACNLMHQVAQFERSFEQKYPLCLECQNIVTNVLHKQTLWLIQYKMLCFKQKPIRKLIENREKIQGILHTFLFVLALNTVYFTETLCLPLCGIFFQLAICAVRPINKWQHEIFPIIGWACLILIKLFSSNTVLKLIKIYSFIDLAFINDKTYQYLIITIGTTIGLSNLKFKSHGNSNEFVSFKKLESSNKHIVKPFFPSLKTDKLLNEEKNLINNKKLPKKFYSPIHSTDTFVLPSSIETTTALKSTNFSQWSSEEKGIFSPNYVLSKRPNLTTQKKNFFSKLYNNENCTLNDSLSSLNSLSLGTQKNISKSHSPRIFETRIYGTTSPNIFNRHQYSHKRSILAPAKLQSVTQTSWVAGGYWQSVMETPMLSRSSSQSSSFGSSGSNVGQSPEHIVHDFDQCSIASEHSCLIHPNTVLTTKTTDLMKKQTNCSSKCFNLNEVIFDTNSLKYHLKNDLQCNGHTTIITNPIWLPVLLCGSLVFNMIVLGTMLLH